METINLSLNDYKKMKKIIKNDRSNYQYTVDILDKEYPYDTKEFWMLKMVKALNYKNLSDRYNYIYDEMCTILDNIGCCYFHKKPCPYLIKGVCQHRSISCKIFLCSPIEKKYKFKSKVDTYPLLNYFFNRKQKDIIHYSYRQTIDEVVPKLVEYATELK